MRRFVLSLCATVLLIGSTALAPPALSQASGRDCTEYCGERAAKHCDDIDSLGCAFYILGCLAGCNISTL